MQESVMATMSPEEWLAKQAAPKPAQESVMATMSPEDWLAKQAATKPAQESVMATMSPEEWLLKQAPPKPAQEEGSDFMRGLANIPGQIQETYGAAKTLAGLLVNSKDIIQSGLETMESGKKRQTGKESDSFTNAWSQGISTVLTDWLPYQIGSGIGNILETLTFMGVGAVGGAATGAGVGAAPGAIAGAVSRELAKKGIREAAEKMIETETRKVGKEAAEKAAKEFVEAETKKIITEASASAATKELAKTGAKAYGTTAGMAAQAGMHGMGETTSRAVEEAERAGKGIEDVELGRLIPSAMVHGIADFFVEKVGLGALKIGEKSAGNLALDIAKRVAVTGAKETPAELIQTMAERYGAKLSLADAEALKEYVDTAAAAFGMSIGPGGVGGLRTNLAARGPATQPGASTKGLMTTEELDKAKPRPVATAEDIAALMPATTAEGKSLAEASADTLSMKQKADEDIAATEAATKQKLDEALAKGQEAVGKFDADNKHKFKQGEIGAIAKALGITFTKDEKSNEARIGRIRERLAQQGEQNEPAGPIESAAGASTDVAVRPDTAVAPGGAEGPVVGRVAPATTTAGPTAAGTKTQPAALTINDLSPELQEEIATRRDEIAEMQMEGMSPTHPKLKNKIAALNRLLVAHNVTGTLSAKRQSTEENKPRSIPKYEITEEDQRLYNETRDEVNSQVEASNQRRQELVKEHEAALDAFDNAQEGKEEEAAWERMVAAEKALKEHGPEQHKLPEYSKHFDADYKDVYFGNISAPIEVGGQKVSGSNKREHAAAAKALQAYMRRIGGRNKEQMSAETRRIANHYEENRAAYFKLTKVQFPRWQDLTAEQKEIFVNEMRANANANQDIAFVKLGLKLVEDSKQLSEGEKREQQNILERKEQVRVASEAQQEKDRKTREANERNKPGNRQLPNAVTKMVMNGDLQGVLTYMADTKTTALTNPYVRIMKAVAKSLLDLNLNTKIRIVESSEIDGDLAQYNPATDEILVSREGLSSNTILHEVIHAGTVKIINEYLYGSHKLLTAEQLKAVQQLERIMNETQHLAEYYPDAYKNLFEFVSYALTNEALQVELQEASDLNDPDAAKLAAAYEKQQEKVSEERGREHKGPRVGRIETVETILPDLKSKWSTFKLSIARILGVRNVYLRQNKKLAKNLRPDFVMEVSAAFEDMLAKPTAPIYLPFELKAEKEKKPERTKADYALSKEEGMQGKTEGLWHRLTTDKGWFKTAKEFVDRTFALRMHERQLQMAKKIVRDVNGAFNNVSEQLDLATGEGRNFLIQKLKVPMDALSDSIATLSRITGKKVEEDILPELHMLYEAFGEEERRLMKWVFSVPLDKDNQNLMHNGKPITAAQRRIDLVGDIRTGAEGLIHKFELTPAQMQQVRAELEFLANNYADPLGDSPRIKNDQIRARALNMRQRKNQLGVMDIDKNSNTYNVLGITPDAAKERIAAFEALKESSPQEYEALKNIMASIREITEQTAELNKIGNYWSFPVSNLVGIYNYQHYVPFKGLAKHSVADELIEPEGPQTGTSRVMQQKEEAANGRFSVSDNPILQVMSDAFRAAGRAGRRNAMQAILNAVMPNKLNPNGTGIINGEVVDRIKFSEYQSTDMDKYKGDKYIFVYNPDATLSVVKINDEAILRAIKYKFEQNGYFVDLANKVTSFFGSMHTRWNFNFAPKNFVSDTLQNAWNIGAGELGPLKSLKYLNEVSSDVVKNGLGKAMHVAALYELGDAASNAKLKQMVDSDPFVHDMVEMLKIGGKTSYLMSFSLKSSLQALQGAIGKNGIVKTIEGANQIADIWNAMFEFTSRAAAYRVFKQEFLKQEIERGTSNERGGKEMSPAELAAAWRAAAATKNLTNFELVGEKSKYMTAFYMFFKASAVSAARTMEAVAPAFRPMSMAEKNLPDIIRNDAAALKNWREEYAKLQQNSQIMVGALIGLGFATYYLSMLGAPDDEWGRNAVKNDNMDQWTRYARFHLPNSVSQSLGLGKDIVFQIPWGFGLGAFSSMGAQMAGIYHGQTSFKDGMANIMMGSLADAFLPLPVSKIPFSDKPGMAVFDTIMPSVLRPYAEYLMNTDGVGRGINSTMNRRLGDAYTGSDRIPQAYKDASDFASRATNGWLDWSPNTMYFFANSYIDGIARVGEVAYSWSNIVPGRKEFSPKSDLPLFGSFFGAKSNVDSRQYGDMEQRIKEMDRRIYTMEHRNPENLPRYESEHPFDRAIVEAYKARQGALNKLREEATKVRADKYLSYKDKESMVKIVTFEENLLKHAMIEDFKAYGMKP